MNAISVPDSPALTSGGYLQLLHQGYCSVLQLPVHEGSLENLTTPANHSSPRVVCYRSENLTHAISYCHQTLSVVVAETGQSRPSLDVPLSRNAMPVFIFVLRW